METKPFVIPGVEVLVPASSNVNRVFLDDGRVIVEFYNKAVYEYDDPDGIWGRKVESMSINDSIGQLVHRMAKETKYRRIDN